MKKDKVFDDKRLLGVLDGVDQKFIAEALEYYDDPIPGKTKKARAALYKRIALLAASIVFCAAAFPVVNYVLPRLGVVFGGNAGAGESSDVELNEYGSPYERAIDAYPADMPADEIYADVLKGGWVVKCEYFGELAAGEDLWDSFFEKTQNGEQSSVLFARYFSGINDNDESSIYLYEIVYDGKMFYHKAFSCQDDTIFHQHEYKFLKKGNLEYTESGQSYFSEAYFLTNTDWITWEFLRPFRIGSSYSPEVGLANDYNYLILELIYKN